MSHTASYAKVALYLHTSSYDDFLKENGYTQTTLAHELVCWFSDISLKLKAFKNVSYNLVCKISLKHSKMSHTTSYVKVALYLHTSLYDECLKESG